MAEKASIAPLSWATEQPLAVLQQAVCADGKVRTILVENRTSNPIGVVGEPSPCPEDVWAAIERLVETGAA